MDDGAALLTRIRARARTEVRILYPPLILMGVLFDNSVCPLPPELGWLEHSVVNRKDTGSIPVGGACAIALSWIQLQWRSARLKSGRAWFDSGSPHWKKCGMMSDE